MPSVTRAEDAVLVVEVRRRPVGEEELAAVRAGAGIGHRQGAGRVVAQRRIELVIELVAGAAGARCPSGRRPGP